MVRKATAHNISTRGSHWIECNSTHCAMFPGLHISVEDDFGEEAKGGSVAVNQSLQRFVERCVSDHVLRMIDGEDLWGF